MPFVISGRTVTEQDISAPNGDAGRANNSTKLKRHEVHALSYQRVARDAATVPGRLQRFNWHGLRHFAISCWIEAGLPPKTVQTFAGHAPLQVTMDRCGHLFPNEDHTKVMDHIAKELFA
jgi:integrase